MCTDPISSTIDMISSFPWVSLQNHLAYLSPAGPSDKVAEGEGQHDCGLWSEAWGLRLKSCTVYIPASAETSGTELPLSKSIRHNSDPLKKGRDQLFISPFLWKALQRKQSKKAFEGILLWLEKMHIQLLPSQECLMMLDKRSSN